MVHKLPSLLIFVGGYLSFPPFHKVATILARMAETADASVLKTDSKFGVRVRFPLRAFVRKNTGRFHVLNKRSNADKATVVGGLKLLRLTRFL